MNDLRFAYYKLSPELLQGFRAVKEGLEKAH
ncbi:hypothetical protein SAMN05421579_10163 [Xenorhabdus japonica]|uniref:Uncharacterized protein n=1 Tax=Xenorhabdus japonica TaxID=53341 RepID=A0A1I4Y8X6_9GAMM|nr:hypothetical protein SAMN05421579_10163 [Xenorhabdus japonica]